MPSKDTKSFKEHLNNLLLARKIFENNEILDFISYVLNKRKEEELPVFLKNYLIMVAQFYKHQHTIKKIIELVFDELIDDLRDNLEAFKELYGLFNLLSSQKLSKDPQLLQKLYKTLALQNKHNHSTGLYIIVTKHYDHLLKNLIDLATNDPERIKDLYSALPLQNKHGHSALNTLSNENPTTRFNQIKMLIEPSSYKKFITTVVLRKKTIIKQLNEIQGYCLGCLKITQENCDERTSLEQALTYIYQLDSLPALNSMIKNHQENFIEQLVQLNPLDQPVHLEQYNSYNSQQDWMRDSTSYNIQEDDFIHSPNALSDYTTSNTLSNNTQPSLSSMENEYSLLPGTPSMLGSAHSSPTAQQAENQLLRLGPM